MKKSILYILFIILVTATTKAENEPDTTQIKRTLIARKVRELAFDSINLSSPLNSFLSRSYVMRSGKRGLWHDISTIAYSELLPVDAPNVNVSDNETETCLETEILEIITYKDSVAIVINRSEPDLLGLYLTVLENGRWVNNGDDLSNGSDGKINYPSSMNQKTNLFLKSSLRHLSMR